MFVLQRKRTKEYLGLIYLFGRPMRGLVTALSAALCFGSEKELIEYCGQGLTGGKVYLRPEQLHGHAMCFEAIKLGSLNDGLREVPILEARCPTPPTRYRSPST